MILTVENQKDIHNINFSNIIDNVNLNNLSKFILSVYNEDWVKECYWNKNPKSWSWITTSEMYWVIYSYLISTKTLIIENEYYIGRKSGSQQNEFKEKDSYYNPLQSSLYHPILNRLVNNNYLETRNTNGYKLSHKVFRELKLKRILNEN